jgi:hypothetical protein
MFAVVDNSTARERRRKSDPYVSWQLSKVLEDV